MHSADLIEKALEQAWKLFPEAVSSCSCVLVWICYYVCCLASGNASQHIMSRSPSLELWRVEAGRASGIRIPWGAWLGLLSISSVWLLQAC